MKITMLAAIAAMAAAPIAVPTAARGDRTSPCSDGQVQVSTGGIESASGHREVLLIFSLALGADPCTLTGHPGVDSGASADPRHAHPLRVYGWRADGHPTHRRGVAVAAGVRRG